LHRDGLEGVADSGDLPQPEVYHRRTRKKHKTVELVLGRPEQVLAPQFVAWEAEGQKAMAAGTHGLSAGPCSSALATAPRTAEREEDGAQQALDLLRSKEPEDALQRGPASGTGAAPSRPSGAEAVASRGDSPQPEAAELALGRHGPGLAPRRQAWAATAAPEVALRAAGRDEEEEDTQKAS